MTASSDLDLDVLRSILSASLDGIVAIGRDRRYVYVNSAAAAILGVPAEQLIGVDLLDTLAEHERERMAQRFGTALDGGARRDLTIRRVNGEEREVEYTVNGVPAGKDVIALVIFRDVTDARRREREATALAKIASSLTLDAPVEAVLDTLAASVVEATGAVACTLALTDPDGALRVLASRGLPDGYAATVERIWCAAGAVVPIRAIQSRQILTAPDARLRMLAHPAYAALHATLATVSWDASIALPLVARDRALGVLIAFYPAPGPPDADVVLLAAIADQAAVTVENQRLYREAQGKAALEERQRLARELHDSVSQALYGIGLGARTARALLQQDPARAVEPVDYVLQLAEAGLAEMHALIFELRPESLESEGLVVALEKLAAALHARHRIEVRAVWCDEPPTSLALKEAVFRIVQEALHNVVKHARATRVDLELACDERELRVRVSDDGVGFDPTGRFPGHLGLRSMRERAEGLGGSLTVTSSPGAGATIAATLPIPAAAHASAA